MRRNLWAFGLLLATACGPAATIAQAATVSPAQYYNVTEIDRSDTGAAVSKSSTLPGDLSVSYGGASVSTSNNYSVPYISTDISIPETPPNDGFGLSGFSNSFLGYFFRI